MIYDKKPKNFVADQWIVGCSINFDGKILLLHRQSNKIHGDKWGAPGGKIDYEDKNKTMAMIRELFEETGIDLKKSDLLFHKTFYVIQPDSNFYYHYFSFSPLILPNVTLSRSEHKAYAWVSPIEALDFDLIPDEDHCIKYLYFKTKKIPA